LKKSKNLLSKFSTIKKNTKKNLLNDSFCSFQTHLFMKGGEAFENKESGERYMSKDYTQTMPVLQLGAMNCWAASMEWWLKYMSPERAIMYQDQIAAIENIDKHIDYNVDSPQYGGLTEDGMKALCLEFQMDYLVYGTGNLGIDLNTIKYRLDNSGAPLLIVFQDPAVQGGLHANVIVRRFKTLGVTRGVVAMEPRNPSFSYRFMEYYQMGNAMLAWKK
jgi:hypothetical protein